MDIYTLYIRIILVIIIIILLYLSFLIHIDSSLKKDVPDNILTFKQIESSLDTGDLILMSSLDFGSKYIRYFTNSYFSHIAMVIKRNDKLYLWEADVDEMKDEKYKKDAQYGTRIVNLKEKLSYYSNNFFGFLKLNTKIDPYKKLNYNYIKKYIKRFRFVHFNSNLLLWFLARIRNKTIDNVCNLITSEKDMYCSELIGRVFQDLNILKRDRHPRYYSPEDFISPFIYNYKYIPHPIQYFEYNKIDDDDDESLWMSDKEDTTK